jgi:hypothetical protein
MIINLSMIHLQVQVQQCTQGDLCLSFIKYGLRILRSNTLASASWVEIALVDFPVAPLVAWITSGTSSKLLSLSSLYLSGCGRQCCDTRCLMGRLLVAGGRLQLLQTCLQFGQPLLQMWWVMSIKHTSKRSQGYGMGTEHAIPSEALHPPPQEMM